MARGAYGKRKVTGRTAVFASGGRSHERGAQAGGRKESENKAKIVSIKNQIRFVERLLKRPLLSDVKGAHEKRLEALKKQAESHARCELEQKMSVLYRRVKFCERRKIERRIRRLDKQQRSIGADENGVAADRLSGSVSRQRTQLEKYLNYVRFFPKTEKYVSLFLGVDGEVVKARRKDLRTKISRSLAAAIAAGVDIEETGSEDDAVDISEDDFFLARSSSDDADADDELTDKSPRRAEEMDDTSQEVPALLISQIPENALRGFGKLSKEHPRECLPLRGTNTEISNGVDAPTTDGCESPSQTTIYKNVEFDFIQRRVVP